MAIALALGRAGAVERLLDRAPHDELVAEDAHRRGHRLAHHRLARARGEAAQRGAQIVRRRARRATAAGQHQRPGRGVDEERVRMAEMARPIGRAELVADQPVDGLGVGHAQQRLGEAHQRHALLRGQRVFVQERVDAAVADGARGGPRRRDCARSRRCGRAPRTADRRRARIAATASVSSMRSAGADRGAQRRGRRRRVGEHETHRGFLSAIPPLLRSGRGNLRRRRRPGGLCGARPARRAALGRGVGPARRGPAIPCASPAKSA